MRLLLPLALLAPTLAEAAYSPPLARVRIDEDRLTFAPSLFFANEQSSGSILRTELLAIGPQLILQKEWRFGLGVQGGLALGHATVGAGPASDQGALAESTGILTGAQLRIYYMVFASRSDGRPHALTVFTNLRYLAYDTSTEVFGGLLTAKLSAVSAGVGAMAEIALGDHVSVLPYAWFSPSLHTKRSYGFGAVRREETGAISVRQPLRVGIDVWIYPFGAHSEDHIALGVIGSLLDTEGGDNQEVAGVLGYSF